jgi:hypothetical protein
VILVGRQYWQGLTDWMQSTQLREGKISAEDMQLFKVVDTPEEVVEVIKAQFIPECVRVPQMNGENHQ